MNLLQIEAGLINETITLDTKGHMMNPILDHLSDYIKHKTNWIKQLEKGSYVGHDKKVWTKEECDNMIKYLKFNLERNYEPGQFIFDTVHYCFDCGLYFHFMIVDDKTVSLIDFGTYDNIREKKCTNKIDYIMDVSEIPDCLSKPYRDANKLVAEIDVPTGEFLFVNYFNKKEIYSMPNEYASENSINSIRGRARLMDYLATKNIGYGQMGNMSVNVFVNKTGDEIIIGDTIKHKGFKNLGSISLEVWRWMCGDLEVLLGHGEKLPDNIIVSKKTENNYKDYILTKVKSGRWVIEHYYDFCDNDDKIYSKLYLKK